MATGKSLTEAQNSRLRAVVEQVLRTKYGGNASALARAVEYTQGSFSQFLRGHTGGSLRLINAMIRLSGEPESWFLHGVRKGDGERQVPIERYDNRAIAIEVARRDGISEEALRVVQDMPLLSHEDPPPKWWREQIDAEAGRLRYGRFRHPKTARNAPVVEDELPKPEPIVRKAKSKKK